METTAIQALRSVIAYAEQQITLIEGAQANAPADTRHPHEVAVLAYLASPMGGFDGPCLLVDVYRACNKPPVTQMAFRGRLQRMVRDGLIEYVDETTEHYGGYRLPGTHKVRYREDWLRTRSADGTMNEWRERVKA